jgi:hypothetical protein
MRCFDAGFGAVCAGTRNMTVSRIALWRSLFWSWAMWGDVGYRVAIIVLGLAPIVIVVAVLFVK